MASRMDKYYNSTTSARRSANNEELYEKIYTDEKYSNITGVATLEKTNEIDLTKVREMISSREDYNRMKNYRELLDKPEAVDVTEEFEPPLEQKVFDINTVLEKAKNERSVADELAEYRRLRNTQFEILKKLNVRNNEMVEELGAEKKDPENKELKDLINTITNTTMLKQIGDEDLSLSMLSELKPSENTTHINTSAIQNVIDEVEKKEVENYLSESENNMDKSFYTSSMNFSKDDFEDLKDLNEAVKKNNILITIILIVLGLVVLAVLGFFIFTFFLK